MKVLICGSRTWYQSEPIRKRLVALPLGTLIISGAAPGADSIAASLGRDLGFEVQEFPADWDRFGKKAGILRNIAMLDQKPDLVIAFYKDRSPGTSHTIFAAKQRGISVEEILEEK